LLPLLIRQRHKMPDLTRQRAMLTLGGTLNRSPQFGLKPYRNLFAFRALHYANMRCERLHGKAQRETERPPRGGRSNLFTDLVCSGDRSRLPLPAPFI
jgi:hypothetical protein